MSVYGNFLNAFPELYESATVTNPTTGSRTIKCVINPDSGLRARHHEISRGGSIVDLTDRTTVFVKASTGVQVGDDFVLADQVLRRIRSIQDYDKAAGFFEIQVERVAGSRPDQTEELKVQEPYFA